MAERFDSFLFKPDVISEYERMSLVGDRARGMKMTTHEKKKMTRNEAIEIFKKYHVYGDPNDTIDFYIEAGMLEIVEEEFKLDIGLNTIFGKSVICDVNHIIERLAMAGFTIIKNTKDT